MFSQNESSLLLNIDLQKYRNIITKLKKEIIYKSIEETKQRSLVLDRQSV